MERRRGNERASKRARATTRERETSRPPMYTCYEREGRGGRGKYLYASVTACTCSNAKVISPVTCRSSVKYLMNPRPRGGVFIGVIPREKCARARARSRRSLRPFFRGGQGCRHTAAPSFCLRPRCSRAPHGRFRPSIKSHPKRSCYNDIGGRGVPVKCEGGGE